jgi:hypothetical protein
MLGCIRSIALLYQLEELLLVDMRMMMAMVMMLEMMMTFNTLFIPT